MHFIITTEHQGQRLDKFLKEQFPELSRAQLQKLIAAGSVKVNDKRVPVHYFLRAGDEVEAVIEAPEELQVKANAGVRIVKCAPTPPNLPSGRGGKSISPPLGGGVRGGPVCIIHEEPDFIVVNKPAGLVVHQGEGHKAPDTLVNGLLARYPEIARIGDDLVRPGIVHRLDADVSGVMVVARTPDMFDHLKRQFKLHEVEKEYVAVVEGKVSPSSGVIEFALARKGARMVARPRGAEGRKAVTEYEIITAGQQDNRTALRIRTRTGRTHQIRVHLKAIGHAIVGDKLYSKAKRPPLNLPLDKGEKEGVGQLMLQARKLGFKDLKGKWREFIIEQEQQEQ